MGRLVEDMTAKGALLGAEPLAPRAQCARVKLSNGAFSVSDAGERIGGYAFLEAASKAEAIELCKAFLDVAGDGVSEIRQLHEESDFAPPPAPAR